MLSSIESKTVKVVWHKKFFDACKCLLSDSEYQTMINELNRIIQNSIDNNSDIVVSSFIPGNDWSDTVWEPIYTKACNFDFDHAAQFFGLLVCQALIDRKENWYFIKQEYTAKGMIYFRSQKKPESKLKNKISETEKSFAKLKNKFGD